MGRASKWIRSFLLGKKDNERDSNDNKITTPAATTATAPIQNQPPEKPPSAPIPISPATPKEKRRWSFRRSVSKDSGRGGGDRRDEHDDKAQAAAAVRIQAAFRAYLARKALCALKGIVKLQALARGELVRREATATLRCMQAMLKLQGRARTQRILMAGQGRPHQNHRKSTQESRTSRHQFLEVEEPKETTMTMSRSSYSNHTQLEGYGEPGLSSTPYCPTNYTSQHLEYITPHSRVSPAASVLTNMSPRAYSGYFGDYFTTAQSSPKCHSVVSRPDVTKLPFSMHRPDSAGSSMSLHHHNFFPNYMANTESSRAKARSQSTPKQRPADMNAEKLAMSRRQSVEGRNIPRVIRMQRSSSHVGSSVAQNYQLPWSVNLDRSTVSLKDSECESTSTVLTNTAFCRTLVGFDPPEDGRILST